MSIVKTKIVHSENPLEHWSDITDLKNKCVLDLGCGWINQGFQSTPEYFLSRGASKIIGVDETCTEINSLTEIYPSHTFLCGKIDTADDLSNLIKTYKPEFIKMDIEGFEVLIKDIPVEVFSSVEEMAVEYHNPECKEVLINKFKELNFEVFASNSFGWYCTDPNIMGIIHAKKKKLKVLVFTSAYYKRAYMMRQSILSCLNQTYKNLVHSVNITLDSTSTTKNLSPLYDDLVNNNVVINYSDNYKHYGFSHFNNMNCIKFIPDYESYDLFIKMDDDDIHKSNYVKNIVKAFEENPDVDIVSSFINVQLNGHDLYRASPTPFDNLGGNPGGSDYHMPMTFAFNKKALDLILPLTEADVCGHDDMMWRVAWVKAGLKHATVNNNDEIIWNIHGENASVADFLKK